MKKFLIAVGIGLALTSAAWAGEPPVWTYKETKGTWRGEWGAWQTLEGTISDGNWTFTVKNVTGGDCFELTGYSAGSGVLDMSTLPKISNDSRAFSRLYMDKCDNLADANGIKFQDVVTKVVFPPFLGATTWDGSKMAPGREPAWFNCSSLVKFPNVTEADFSHCTELSRVYSMFTAKHPALTTLRLPEVVQTVKNSVFTAPNLKAIYWNGPVPTSVDKSAWVAGQTNFVLQAYAASWAAACEVEHPLETGKVGQLKSDYVGMEYGRTKCVYVAFADEGGSDDPDTPGGGDDPETPGEESEPASTNLTVELYAPVADEADFYSVRGAALKAGASVDDTQKPVIFAIKAVELDGLAYWKFGVSNLWCGMSYALCQSKELVPTDDFSPVTNAPAGGEAQSGCEAATLCIVHSDGSVRRTDNRYAEETPADPKPVHSAIALAVEGWTGSYDGLAHGATVKSVNPSDAIVKWTTDGGSEFADACPTLTHVGTLTVRARAEKAATAGTVWEPAEATADIKITTAVNEWAVEPSLSETSWKVGDEKPTVNNGQAKFGEVSANYTQATLPTAAGSYEATFTVPASGDWSNVLSKSIPFTITDGGEEPPEEPDDPPSGDTVRLNVLFTGAAYGVYEQTVAKGQSTAVDFSPLVKNVSVAAVSASAGTVSGSTLSLPASALGADLTVNVMLRESASAGAVEVGGWKTRLANADVNGDGIVKVLGSATATWTT